MAWDPLLTADIAVGKVVKRSMLQKIKDCLDYLNGTLGTLAGGGVPNGSFEVDSDSNGVPDSWTKNLYPGGSGAIETTSPAAGAAAYSFTHPGGANNGGGYLTSDYIECSEYVQCQLSLIHWATAAGMKNQVQFAYYTKAKVYISTATVYSSTLNPTNPKLFYLFHTPPATARYYKIILIGGYSDTDVAGTAYFDAVQINFIPGQIQTQSAEFTYPTCSANGPTVWTNTGVAQQIVLPFKGIDAKIILTGQQAYTSHSGYPTQARFRVNTSAIYSTEVSTAATAYTTLGAMTIDITAAENTGTLTLQLQLNAGSIQPYCYFRKTVNTATAKATYL